MLQQVISVSWRDQILVDRIGPIMNDGTRGHTVTFFEFTYSNKLVSVL